MTLASEPQPTPSPASYSREWQYAGFWWRFFAFSIDNVIVGALVGLFWTLTTNTSGVYVDGQGYVWPTFHPVSNCLNAMVVQWLYFSLFECSKQQATPGKKFCHLIVTDLKGDRISFLQASGRYFGKYVSTFICGIGYLMAAFTAHKQALHDILADTLVWRSAQLKPPVVIDPDLQPRYPGRT